MSYRKPMAIASAALCAALGALPGAQAAEGFQIRYNLAGSIGGEMFGSYTQAGPIGVVAVTYIKIKKVTGEGGGQLTRDVPGGKVPVTDADLAPFGFLKPFILANVPNYVAGKVNIDATGTLTLYNLALGYVTTERYGGGRLVYGLNLPYAKKKQWTRASGDTPRRVYGNPFVEPFGESLVAPLFNKGYQAQIRDEATAESGEVSGIGDVELSIAWASGGDKLRATTDVALVLPTGKYNAALGPDIGDGKFYTLRPSVQLTYLPIPEVALSGKVTMGFNSNNRASNVHSGDWAAVEGAAGYMTRLGPVGVHVIHAWQYEDDLRNPFGTSRYRSTGAGVFWTTKVPVIDAYLTMQYMRNTSSANAKLGTLTQMRLVKVF